MSAKSMRSLGRLLESMANLAAPASGIADDGIRARMDWTDRDRSLYAAGIQSASEAMTQWADVIHDAEARTTQPHGTDRAPDTERSEDV